MNANRLLLAGDELSIAASSRAASRVPMQTRRRAP